jgi:isoleucyl-tRNA synthetase
MAEEYKPPLAEKEVLKFWEERNIYRKQKDKGKKGKKFYWICGPPYTSGKFHIGHFWNYASLKDPLFRYLRMKKRDVWDRGGWDMHGLPTARKVMAKLSLKTKEDIEKFGVDKFVAECETYSVETMKEMTKDYIRWGVWYDHENAYQPIKNEFMEGVWWCIKKAHDNGYLYEGDRVMAWCPESETVAAKHELEYVEMTDESIFLKFKLKGKEEYLIVWTTTPWTIPHNLGVMVNPDFEYVKCRVGSEVWIVAKELVEKFFEMVQRDYELIGIVKGKQMEGWEYEPFLADEIPELRNIKKEHKNAFTVLLSKEYVTLDVGSGLVHCAPGCGPEDQEVGMKYHLPAFNEVDQRGRFSDKMGKFKGWIARTDDHKFIEYFESKGSLIHKMKYKHDYPIHERSKCPVIFRTTRQWFFAVEKLKEKMKQWNHEVKWVPEWAGANTFDSWLENLRDIGITRQTIWGTPTPIWRCESCKHYVVVGSLAELKKLSGKSPKNMHRPFIDEITMKCDKCKGTMYRVPDVCDVWLDAGCASWISLYYPQTDKFFKKYWPCDFILEGKEQIRGWFNLLFDSAAVSGLDKPFKACYMTGWTNDALGRKQSKSLGNIVDPYEVINKYGVDTVRYYMMGSAQPGVDMNYNFEDVAAKARNMMVLWNIGQWLLDYAKTNRIRKFDRKPVMGPEEKYMFSKTNRAIRKVTELYNNYKLNEVPLVLEDLYLALSRDYIKWTREKSSAGSDADKYAVAYTVYNCLLNTLKMTATVMPFISEWMHQEIKEVFRTKEESIHLFDWPEADDKQINEKLEDYVKILNSVITAVLSIRDRQKTGIRWPLAKAFVYAEDETIHTAIKELLDMFKNQCNVKAVEFLKEKPEWAKTQFRFNQASMNKKFKANVPMIVGRLVQHSPNSVMAKIEKDGKFVLELDEKKYEITEDDVYFEEEMPDGKDGAFFDGGAVYVDLNLSEDLLAEGFMREIVRRVQELRKEAKMEKNKKAKASVMVESYLQDMLKGHVKEIEERTSCKLKLGIGERTSETLNKVIEIKGRKIAVGLTPA